MPFFDKQKCTKPLIELLNRMLMIAVTFSMIRSGGKKKHFAVRMGASVNEPLETDNPMIIDYATNGSRNDRSIKPFRSSPNIALAPLYYRCNVA